MVWTENQYQNHKDRPSQNGGNLPRQTKQILGTTNHLYHVGNTQTKCNKPNLNSKPTYVTNQLNY